MSVDEAMDLLHQRQAERAAQAATQPASTQPSVAAAAPGNDRPDLSLRVEALESEISEDFSGPIGAMWAPADTQQWLDNKAASAAAAASKLVGSEATAKIILDSSLPGPAGICVQGHLFPIDQRLTLSTADHIQLKPEQDQFDTAADRLESLHQQLTRLNNELNMEQMHNSNSGPVFQFQDNVTQLNFDIQNVQGQITSAESDLSSAKEKLGDKETQLLSQDRQRMQIWGPITIATADSSFLKDPPGTIVSVPVRVSQVAATVTRNPDGAGWDYSSDVGDQGQTRMPTAPDDLGSGPIAPSIQTTVRLVCDDLAFVPTPAPPPAQVAMLASSTEQLQPSLPSIVSDPHNEAALTASVGFVVVGFQALLPDGKIFQRPMVSGSCFAVTSDGYLLTNRHVVAELANLDDPTLHDDFRNRWNVDFEREIWVFFGKEQYDARVDYVSPKFDLAVLRIFRHGQIFFRLADRPDDPRGADVFAAGFPGLGSEAITRQELAKNLQADDALSLDQDLKSQFKQRDFEYTLTKGAIGRTISDGDGERWIQHEAVIRHGNSGGPLINESGVVVGINTRMQRDAEGDVQTNLSQEISQFRQELDANIPGLIWVAP
jgi:S1-C subfamily serine protease